jgi:hypothetical protein
MQRAPRLVRESWGRVLHSKDLHSLSECGWIAVTLDCQQTTERFEPSNRHAESRNSDEQRSQLFGLGFRCRFGRCRRGFSRCRSRLSRSGFCRSCRRFCRSRSGFGRGRCRRFCCGGTTRGRGDFGSSARRRRRCSSHRSRWHRRGHRLARRFSTSRYPHSSAGQHGSQRRS